MSKTQYGATILYTLLYSRDVMSHVCDYNNINSAHGNSTVLLPFTRLLKCAWSFTRKKIRITSVLLLASGTRQFLFKKKKTNALEFCMILYKDVLNTVMERTPRFILYEAGLVATLLICDTTLLLSPKFPKTHTSPDAYTCPFSLYG